MKSKRTRRIFRNQRGQGLIEYLIIVALMGVATIAIVRVMGETVAKRFAYVTDALQGQTRKASTVKINEGFYRRKDLGNFFGNSAGGKGSQSDSSEGGGQ